MLISLYVSNYHFTIGQLIISVGKSIVLPKNKLQGEPPYPPISVFSLIEKLAADDFFTHQQHFVPPLYTYSCISRYIL